MNNFLYFCKMKIEKGKRYKCIKGYSEYYYMEISILTTNKIYETKEGNDGSLYIGTDSGWCMFSLDDERFIEVDENDNEIKKITDINASTILHTEEKMSGNHFFKNNEIKKEKEFKKVFSYIDLIIIIVMFIIIIIYGILFIIMI